MQAEACTQKTGTFVPHGVLLVLDGLEKVRDTGQRSGYFGRLLDGRLRDLVS